MKNNASRGLILYLIAIAAVVMLIVTVSNKWQLKDAYNYKKFSSDLKDNKIELDVLPKCYMNIVGDRLWNFAFNESVLFGH